MSEPAPVGPWDAPLIIAVAPNGARLGPSDHSALPITPAQIARAARDSQRAGATLLHLHVRDPAGGHSISPDHYRPAIEAVRDAVGDAMIIQITTEAAGRFGIDVQMATVRALLPEAASMAIRELVPDHDAEPAMAEFALAMAEANVSPQYILYDDADVERFADLLARRVLRPDRASALFVLGRYAAGQRSRPIDLLSFLAAWRRLGQTMPWFVCAFGPLEHACALAAAAFGGHCRVGFENNRVLATGAVAPDNAALVAQAATAAAALGRPIADAAAARSNLAIRG